MEINVRITKYADRRFWQMYYDDPLTGKRSWRSTKQTTKREAERASAKWEAELREGRYKPASNITWEEFRERYEDEVLPSLAKRTDRMMGTVFNAIEKICNPRRVRDLTPERLSYFQSELRKGRSETTVRTYLAHLSSALQWAVDMKMLPEIPAIKMPKRAKGAKLMKGRPIAAEEFERMLMSTESGLTAAGLPKQPKRERKRKLSDEAMARKLQLRRERAAQVAESWRYFLTGLHLSGLRLGEGLDLYWDRPDKLQVDLDGGRRPMFIIRAELEKGNQDRLLPMTPDFAEFLDQVPCDERTGPVFHPLSLRDGRECRNPEWVGRVISAIGKAAGVIVDRKGDRIKYASAHDLRRSFGARWAPRVMPAV